MGPYEVVAPLGAGGMAEVYRARDTRLGRDIALKVVNEALAESRSSPLAVQPGFGSASPASLMCEGGGNASDSPLD